MSQLQQPSRAKENPVAKKRLNFDGVLREKRQPLSTLQETGLVENVELLDQKPAALAPSPASLLADVMLANSSTNIEKASMAVKVLLPEQETVSTKDVSSQQVVQIETQSQKRTEVEMSDGLQKSPPLVVQAESNTPKLQVQNGDVVRMPVGPPRTPLRVVLTESNTQRLLPQSCTEVQMSVGSPRTTTPVAQAETSTPKLSKNMLNLVLTPSGKNVDIFNISLSEDSQTPKKVCFEDVQTHSDRPRPMSPIDEASETCQISAEQPSEKNKVELSLDKAYQSLVDTAPSDENPHGSNPSKPTSVGDAAMPESITLARVLTNLQVKNNTLSASSPAAEPIIEQTPLGMFGQIFMIQLK